MSFFDAVNGPSVGLGIGLGNACSEIKAIQPWPIIIKDPFLTIGCQKHTFGEWYNFSEIEIREMHTAALEWWQLVKKPLFALLESMGIWMPPKESKGEPIGSDW